MPYPYPIELVQIMSAHGGSAPVCLLDVVTTDGTSYHWANVEIDVTPVYTGTHPSWLAGLANPPANYDTHYFPWLLSASGFQESRAMQSTTATIEIQNVSGNTIQRDLAGLLTARTFEGALFAFREWNLVAQSAEYEQHGRLTVTGGTEMQTLFSTPTITTAIPTTIPRLANGASEARSVVRRRRTAIRTMPRRATTPIRPASVISLTALEAF
jgi:hypothetical protein